MIKLPEFQLNQKEPVLPDSASLQVDIFFNNKAPVDTTLQLTACAAE